jgi:hypothetical protein
MRRRERVILVAQRDGPVLIDPDVHRHQLQLILLGDIDAAKNQQQRVVERVDGRPGFIVEQRLRDERIEAALLADPGDCLGRVPFQMDPKETIFRAPRGDTFPMALFATAFAVDHAGKAQTRLGSGLQHGILHRWLSHPAFRRAVDDHESRSFQMGTKARISS